ncbi:hypothetical protein ABTK98_19715, partial [Acinetobacter baumannii]
RPTVILVFDRLADALFIVAPVWPHGAAAALDHAIERIEAVSAALATAPLPAPVRAEPQDITPNPVIAPDAYRAMVARAKNYIVAGDIF